MPFAREQVAVPAIASRSPLLRAAARLLAISAWLWACPCVAGTNAEVIEVRAELPLELRRMAGRGEVSPVTQALVTIALPPGLGPGASAPVLVVNATSDRPWQSSRALLRAYLPVARDRGWILVAADPSDDVALEDDHASLRMSLAIAALAVLRQRAPGQASAALAFGGFSGGSKYTGWLAAAFAAQGRPVIGVYLSGCNENELLGAARHFGVLDERLRRVPVFLQSGIEDRVATPDDHRRIARELTRADFERVRVHPAPGGHEVTPGPLGEALDWFARLRARRPQS